MPRIVALCAAAFLVLAGCDGGDPRGGPVAMMRAEMAPAPPPPPGARDADAPAGPDQDVRKLAYSHRLSLEMDADKVAPRFEHARQQCLENRELRCILMHASIAGGDANSGTSPRASLTVRLPHETVGAFETALLTPLEGEGEGEPTVRNRATDAEDLTYVIFDTDSRLAQATDYRERLTALAKRAEAKVGDLIQVEEKLSEVQQRIEALAAQQRGLNQRVDTELFYIDLGAYATLADASSPLGEAWREAGRTLGESAAGALTFLIAALPWLPILAILAFLVMWLWRVVRKARPRASRASEPNA